MKRLLLLRRFSLVTAVITTVSWAQGSAAQDVAAASTVGAAAIAQYWTSTRMSAATPLDVPLTAASNEASTRMAAAAGADGTPGAIAGTPPTLESGGSASQPAVTRGTSGTSIAPADTAAPADGAYPGPNNTYVYSPKYRKFPISTVGKLFFTEPGNGDYVCTATATSGGGNLNTIWTAGHCVAGQGSGSYYNNFMFCPSYDSSQGGVNPAVGCWAYTSVITTSAWLNNGSWTRDYAAITLATSGTVINSSIVTAVGGLGFAWNQARDQHWFHYGYPSATPYTGGAIVATATEHRYDDSDSDAYGPATNAWGTAQTPGSSGSALILSFDYTTGGSINSNVSFYYTSPTNEYGIMLHGPYYDTTSCSFWKSATGWSGTC